MNQRFKEGEFVSFSTGEVSGVGRIRGRCVGVSLQWNWIIEIRETSEPEYNYSCLVIPNSFVEPYQFCVQ